MGEDGATMTSPPAVTRVSVWCLPVVSTVAPVGSGPSASRDSRNTFASTVFRVPWIPNEAWSRFSRNGTLEKKLTAFEKFGDRLPKALEAMKPGGKAHPIDRVIHDGDTVTLGGTTLTAADAAMIARPRASARRLSRCHKSSKSTSSKPAASRAHARDRWPRSARPSSSCPGGRPRGGAR